MQIAAECCFCCYMHAKQGTSDVQEQKLLFKTIPAQGSFTGARLLL